MKFPAHDLDNFLMRLVGSAAGVNQSDSVGFAFRDF
jgi:hypothetical protein